MIEDYKKISIDFIDISSYAEYEVYNHLTKATEPIRTMDFSMPTLTSIEQREIPEIKIKFKYLPLALYQKVFKATRKREFLVEYFDLDYNTVRKGMFYLKDPSTIKTHLIKNKEAVIDYQLDLAATLNPINTLKVTIPYCESYGSGDCTLKNDYLLETNYVYGGGSDNRLYFGLEYHIISGNINKEIDYPTVTVTTSNNLLLASYNQEDKEISIDFNDIKTLGTYMIYIDIFYTENNMDIAHTTLDLTLEIKGVKNDE